MKEIGLKRYRLLFYGNVLDEAEPSAARHALAQRYQLDDKKLTACFSGLKVALHSNLSEPDVYRIQGELEDCGLITHVELLPCAHSDGNAATPPEPDQRSFMPTASSNAEPVVKATTHSEPRRHAADHAFDHASRHPSSSSAGNFSPTNQPNERPCARCLQPLPANARQCNGCGLRITTRSSMVIKSAAIVLLLLALAAGAAWLAWPLYQQQQTHDQVHQAIEQVDDVTEQLRLFIDKTGFWPNSNLDAGLDAPDAYHSTALSSIRISTKALVVVTFNHSLDHIGGQTLLFVPQRGNDNVISWRCDGGTLTAPWRPNECTAPEHSEYQRPNKADPITLAQALPSIPASTTPTGPRASKIQRLLRTEIARTVHVRKAVMQAKIMDGLWPETNAHASLPAARLIGTSAFRKVEVQPEGRILYVFSDQIPSFEGHKLWLVPTSIGEWRCEASFDDSYLPTPCSASISH